MEQLKSGASTLDRTENVGLQSRSYSQFNYRGKEVPNYLTSLGLTTTTLPIPMRIFDRLLVRPSSVSDSRSYPSTGLREANPFAIALVRKVGLEPTRPYGPRLLRTGRLPIPSLARKRWGAWNFGKQAPRLSPQTVFICNAWWQGKFR